MRTETIEKSISLDDFKRIIEEVYNMAIDSSSCSDWHGVNLTYTYEDCMEKAIEMFREATK